MWIFRNPFISPPPSHTFHCSFLFGKRELLFLVLRNFKWLTEHLRILSSGHYPSLSSCAQQDYLDIGAKNGQITSRGPWNVTFPIAGFWNYTKHQGGLALPQRAHCSEKSLCFKALIDWMRSTNILACNLFYSKSINLNVNFILKRPSEKYPAI